MSEEKKAQVVALGKLGWPLRRIEDETGVRRETASGYLKAAGVPVRPPRGWGRLPPSKPANGASTDPEPGPNPANDRSTDLDPGTGPKPANEVSTDLAWPQRPGRAPSASACEPYREMVERAIASGRNAMAIWQVTAPAAEIAGTSGGSARRTGCAKLGAERPPMPAVLVIIVRERIHFSAGAPAVGAKSRRYSGR